MSKQQIAKLKRKGLSVETAQKLVDAGLGTPALIRVATQKELDDAGVKLDDVAAISPK